MPPSVSLALSGQRTPHRLVDRYAVVEYFSDRREPRAAVEVESPDACMTPDELSVIRPRVFDQGVEHRSSITSPA